MYWIGVNAYGAIVDLPNFLLLIEQGRRVKKSPRDRAEEFAQACVAKTPVIILGSGASIPHGIPGMGQLAEALRAVEPPPDMTNDETVQWENFQAQISQLGLEAALNRVQFTDRQTMRVVETTRTFLLPHDVTAFANVLHDRRTLPLGRLYQYLFRSVHRSIDVVTPNYDRLAEYAADCTELRHYVGFASGYMNRRLRDDYRANLIRDGSRTVCIWKVHGSFDWFKHRDETVFALPTCHDVPAGFTPVMVSPGVDKFRRVYDEPFRTILRCADHAMENARSFLCVGFGFNDDHLQTKLIERCAEHPIPITVVTRELTPRARAALLGGRFQRFLVLEACEVGTKMYMNEYVEGVELLEEDLWRFETFLNFAIGAEP